MEKFQICEDTGKLIDKEKTIKELIEQNFSNKNLYTEEKLENLGKVIAHIEGKNNLVQGSVIKLLEDRGLETSDRFINSPRPNDKYLAVEYDIEVLLFYLKQIDSEFFMILMDKKARKKTEINKFIVYSFFAIILYFLIKNL